MDMITYGGLYGYDNVWWAIDMISYGGLYGYDIVWWAIWI